MSPEKKKILSFLLILLAIGGILSWRIWGYRTTILITSSAPFTATFQTEKRIQGETFTCEKSECEFPITPGEYALRIESEGYFSKDTKVEISWISENKIVMPLQKIPSLIPLSEKPASWAKKDVNEEFFLDLTGKLFRKGETENILIAEFPPEEREELKFLGRTPAKLFVLHPQEVYEVDISGKRKYKISSSPEGEILTDGKILSENLLLLEKESGLEKEVFFFSPTDRKSSPFPERITLNHICQNPENSNELFFTKKEQQWLFQKYEKNTGSITGIAGYDFENPVQEIFCETSNLLGIETEKESFRLSF